MGASDYMTGNAPGAASFAAPLLNFSQLGDLPKDYFEGQQRARQRAMQTAFPDGPPIDPATGKPDVDAMIKKGVQIGGLEYAQPLMQMLLGGQMGQQQQQTMQQLDRSAEGGPAMPPIAQNGAAGSPGNLIPRPQAGLPQQPMPQGAQGQQPQPQLDARGASNEGAPTVNSVASEVFGNQENPKITAMLPRYAASVGVRLEDNTPLNPQQVMQLKRSMGETKLSMAGQSDASSGQPQAGADAPRGSTVSGPYGLTTPPSAPRQMAQAPTRQEGPPPPSEPTRNAMSAAQAIAADPQIQQWDKAVKNARSASAGVAGYNPALADKWSKVADDYMARIKQRSETISEGFKLTNEEKLVLNPATLDREGAVKRQEAGVKHSEALYDGLSGRANSSAAMLPNLQLAKSLINHPDFQSGTAEGHILGWKRAMSSLAQILPTDVVEKLGIRPDMALPQEAYRKVLSSNMLHMVDDLRASTQEMGAATSRIFGSQIELIEKAAGNPDNSVAALKFLAELNERAAHQAIEIGNFAADYKTKNGWLDAGFEKQLRSWVSTHPMFTKEELANPAIVGNPQFAKPKTEVSSAGGPKVGAVVNGHRFKGGNPNDEKQWEKVK